MQLISGCGTFSPSKGTPFHCKKGRTVPSRKFCPHIFLPQRREAGLQPSPHIISCCL